MLATPAPFPLTDLARSLTALPGVGPAFARALAKRDLATWGDALFFFPSRYEDRRQVTPLAELQPGVTAVVRAPVATSGRWGAKGKAWRMVLGEPGAPQLTCLWFNYRKAALEAWRPGREVVAVGKVEEDRSGGPLMTHPLLLDPSELENGHPAVGRVVPLYPEVEGVPAGRLARIMSQLVESCAPRIPDPLHRVLPGELYPLPAGEALMQAHLPAEPSDPDQDPPWRRSLAVNELFYFELALALKRKGREKSPARALNPPGDRLAKFLSALPFSLTPGQEAAIAAIRQDLAQPHPMGRLLCGDVGTGKTVVALAAAILAAEAGVQTAFMAPTEILARQHLATLSRHLAPLGVEAALACGSQNGAQRQETRQAAGQNADLVVGTHALFSAGLAFRDLGLVIIDEQHRFGVHQRLRLAAKGNRPHLLVLSATPIPRTLALALAGHLEISDLPQRPQSHPPVQTRVLAFDQRRQAVQALAQTLDRGEQAYVICPLVEPSEAIEAQDALATHRRLAEYFPKVGVGLLHGRLGGPEQEAALGRFASGQDRILVATTVVEVGVDVAQATLMVVLGAERFGLSQLHQLRGRVGRGERPGRCLLVAGPQPGDLAGQRLAVLARTSDGLAVAEADLHLRGPGEVLGSRQSGLPVFRAADWSRDAELVPPMRQIIGEWLAADPELSRPPQQALKEETLRRWGRRLGLAGG